MFRLFPVAALVAVLFNASFSQPSRGTSAADLKLALKKLQVLGAALYVAAHPDDENTAVLAALAKGRSIRTAYLSVTRGEGGQNLIGPEQGEALGVIRTLELLEARRIDGGEQFFTRALDFGYSKSSEETLRIWGREEIIADIVWVIRKFRPDVIMTRFADTLGGHGNHTGSAILAREAFHAAGDPEKFTEQLKYVSPWKPKRLVFNVFRFRGSGMEPTAKAVRLDVGAYSPLLGESFTEIAGKSRTMHKSQGFGAGQNRGRQWQYFEPTAGEPAQDDLFEGIDLTWSRVRGGETVGAILREAEQAFDPDKPSTVVPLLLQAYRAMQSLPADPWVRTKKEEAVEVLLQCAGIWLDATASEPYAPPRGQIEITATALNRSDVPVVLESILSPGDRDSVLRKTLGNNDPVRVISNVKLAADLKYSQPVWLEEDPLPGRYVIIDQKMIGAAENLPALVVRFSIRLAGTTIAVERPVRYRWIDPVDGEQYRPFVIVPPVAVNLTERTFVFGDNLEKEIRLMLKGSGSEQRGTVRLEVPAGWTVTPRSRAFVLKKNGDEAPVTFRVVAGRSARSGRFSAIAETGNQIISVGRSEIHYPHIPIQTLFPPATGALVRVELKTTDRRVGYIAGSGDEIPAALRQIGYSVRMLSDEELELADLSSFDVIVAGVRAYNTRPKLRAHQRRLMEYVFNGGRYVVQYVTRQRPESDDLGPYPFSVSRERVTVEEAPVHFENPNHQLLTTLNRIAKEDFDGWVQERGLYFADSWDPRYEAVLASADPGEPLQKGGLLFGRYGKGVYIYTGYSFFRQLPAGIPGAYRLFVNLLSAQE